MAAEIRVENQLIQALLDRLAARGRDMQPVMAEICNIVVSSIQMNFRNQTSPDGEKWEPSRRALEKGGQTLNNNGRLSTSFTKMSTATRAEIGNKLHYAAIHHFGGIIKPKTAKALMFTGLDGNMVMVKQVKIPARPFMGVKDQDFTEMHRVISRYLSET